MKNVKIQTSVRKSEIDDNKTMYSVIVETEDQNIYASTKNYLSNIVQEKPSSSDMKVKLAKLILDYDRPLNNTIDGVDDVIVFADYLLKNGIQVPSAYQHHGVFKRYCNAHSHCDKCNKKIRYWCNIKDRITKHQEKIINRDTLRY